MAESPAQTPVAIDVEPGFVCARLSYPPANPLSPAVLEGLERAADAVEERGALALVVASSLPGFFAAGADIKHMSSLDGDAFHAYGVQMRHVMERIARLPTFSIAAIDGLALGGGLELAMACTLRIGAQGAALGVPEIKLGLIPGAGGTQRLPRIVGRGRALEILLSGRRVPAEEAYAIGLLDRLVPAGSAQSTAIVLARTLARSSIPAVRSIHRTVEAALDRELEHGLELEEAEIETLFADGEAREGIAAFLARRPPDWSLDV